MIDDYPIFLEWMALTDWVLNALDRFPKSVRLTFSNRIADLCLDVVEGIVKAVYTRNRVGILNDINMKIEILRVLFRISFNRRYLSLRQYEYVSKKLLTCGRMIGGWKKK